jgi:hypothetical protein
MILKFELLLQQLDSIGSMDEESIKLLLSSFTNSYAEELNFLESVSTNLKKAVINETGEIT